MNYVQPGLMDRFNTAKQMEGPTMIFEVTIPGGNGAKAKQSINLDSNYGVRTDIQGLPAVSRSAAKSYDFNPHQPPKAVDLRHVHESPGGLPFSTSHKSGVQRAMSVTQQERQRQFGSGSIGGVASHLLSNETSNAMTFDVKQVRAKTPPFLRGTEQRTGQNRYNVTDSLRVKKPNLFLHQHVDRSRIKTNLVPKIPLNTVTQSAFQTATMAARQEGAQMREFMREVRPELMYYNDATVQGSRQQMLQTKKNNDEKFYSDQHAMKRELLSSQCVRETLEDYHPVQDMQYNHYNNETIGRTWYGAPVQKFQVSDHVDEQSKGWNGQRGTKIINPNDKTTLKRNVAPNDTFRTRNGPAYGKDSRVRGKITAVADPTYRPNAGNMKLDRDSANGVAGIEGNTHNYQTQRAHLKHQKAQMLAGNGNPITGQEPEHYKIPTFRDLELLNHQQYG